MDWWVIGWSVSDEFFGWWMSGRVMDGRLHG